MNQTIEAIKKDRKNEKGITLVALIITIIILIILAIISIKVLLDRKFIELAINETINYAEAQANEEKEMDEIDKKLKKVVNKIIEQANIKNENIILKTEKIISEDCMNAILHVEIEYQEEIKSIMINEEEIEVPIKNNGVYIIEKEVDKNGIYIIVAKDAKGNYNIVTIKVNDIIGDMDIWDKEDMEIFREKVKEGKIFVSTTAKVMDNIDLGGEKWEPIGTAEKPFLGKFEGNGHTINGLNIEGNSTETGLFRYNNGTINNLKIENGYVKSDYNNTGILCGKNSGTISNVEISGTVKGKNITGGIIGINTNEAQILNCKSTANVNGSWGVGGVSGAYGNHSECGNDGNVTGDAVVRRNSRRVCYSSRLL